MKRSEVYQMAMIAVVDNESIEAADKLEIVKVLMSDKNIAVWREENQKQEEQENG